MEIMKMRGAVKNYIWGGTALRDEYGIESDKERIAEAWVISCHKNGASVIVSGEHEGKTLHQLITEHPEYLGLHMADFDEFPILVKLIDAKDDLSVQVHPDDDYAREVEGCSGKTEMWYVIDCEEGASLICGFDHDMTAEEFRRAAVDGTLTEHLKKYDIKKGDVFFIEPGTVHAIGKGIVIAEIQQNSDTTYRVYDYCRTDDEGNTRPLHIDKAIEVAITSPSLDDPGPQGQPEEYNGMTRRLLVDCECFNVWLYDNDSVGTLTVGKESFQALLVVDGQIQLAGMGNTVELKKGDCVFVPAEFGQMRVSGKGKFLTAGI